MTTNYFTFSERVEEAWRVLCEGGSAIKIVADFKLPLFYILAMVTLRDNLKERGVVVECFTWKELERMVITTEMVSKFTAS